MWSGRGFGGTEANLSHPVLSHPMVSAYFPLRDSVLQLKARLLVTTLILPKSRFCWGETMPALSWGIRRQRIWEEGKKVFLSWPLWTTRLVRAHASLFFIHCWELNSAGQSKQAAVAAADDNDDMSYHVLSTYYVPGTMHAFSLIFTINLTKRVLFSAPL